jgi:hypothetical protein
LRKNSEFGPVLKGHEFTRAENARRINAALQVAEKVSRRILFLHSGLI